MKNTRIIAVANQKGGVGKTTTTVNLGASLANKGKNVLLIDCDPQANLSSYLGYKGDDKPTITDLINRVIEKGKVEPEYVKSAVRHNELNKLDYIPSDLALSATEISLLNALSRETILRRVLKKDVVEEYDFVIIDCLPTLSILLINALCAAGELIIPVQTQELAIKGLDALFGVCEQIVDTVNPTLTVRGILPTMCNNTTVTRDALAEIKEKYGDKVFDCCIKNSVEAAKSSKSGKALSNYSNRLREGYDKLAEEIEEVE